MYALDYMYVVNIGSHMRVSVQIVIQFSWSLVLSYNSIFFTRNRKCLDYPYLHVELVYISKENNCMKINEQHV